MHVARVAKADAERAIELGFARAWPFEFHFHGEVLVLTSDSVDVAAELRGAGIPILASDDPPFVEARAVHSACG
jgi:hypothetical protein